MLDPTADEAYSWPADGTDRIAFAPLAPLEPFPETDMSPYVGFVQRFIVGVDQSAFDPEAISLRPEVLWQIPEPMTIRTRNIDPEVLEILYGQAVVPLCNRQLPTKGTE